MTQEYERYTAILDEEYEEWTVYDNEFEQTLTPWECASRLNQYEENMQSIADFFKTISDNIDEAQK